MSEESKAIPLLDQHTGHIDKLIAVIQINQIKLQQLQELQETTFTHISSLRLLYAAWAGHLLKLSKLEDEINAILLELEVEDNLTYKTLYGMKQRLATIQASLK
jgi:hypothetical protein